MGEIETRFNDKLVKTVIFGLRYKVIRRNTSRFTYFKNKAQ